MSGYLEGVVLSIIWLTFVNSTALILATVFLVITLQDLRVTCRKLRRFMVDRFTETVDKI